MLETKGFRKIVTNAMGTVCVCVFVVCGGVEGVGVWAYIWYTCKDKLYAGMMQPFDALWFAELQGVPTRNREQEKECLTHGPRWCPIEGMGGHQ